MNLNYLTFNDCLFINNYLFIIMFYNCLINDNL